MNLGMDKVQEYARRFGLNDIAAAIVNVTWGCRNYLITADSGLWDVGQWRT